MISYCKYDQAGEKKYIFIYLVCSLFSMTTLLDSFSVKMTSSWRFSHLFSKYFPSKLQVIMKMDIWVVFVSYLLSFTCAVISAFWLFLLLVCLHIIAHKKASRW